MDPQFTETALCVRNRHAILKTMDGATEAGAMPESAAMHTWRSNVVYRLRTKAAGGRAIFWRHPKQGPL